MYKILFSKLPVMSTAIILLTLHMVKANAQMQNCTSYWINPKTGVQECLAIHQSVTSSSRGSSSRNTYTSVKVNQPGYNPVYIQNQSQPVYTNNQSTTQYTISNTGASRSYVAPSSTVQMIIRSRR